MTCNSLDEGPGIGPDGAVALEHRAATGNAGARTEAALAEVLAEVLHTERVPVDGHFFADLGADSLVMAHFCARLRKRDDLPTASMKDIYQHSNIRDLAAALKGTDLAPARADAPSGTAVQAPAEQSSDMEASLAKVLAEVLHTERVPVDGHFFAELGADSLVMAHFCARLRKRDDLPTASMKDVYRHSTIRDLAAALVQTDTSPAPVTAGSAEPVQDVEPIDTPVGRPSGRWQYVLCGAAQLLTFGGMSCLGGLAFVRGYAWIVAGSGTVDVYQRAVLFGAAVFLVMCAFPIAAKWLLIGRFTPRGIPVWSFGYLRFWWVKTLIRSSPVRLFIGSPLYVLYLRALGAHIGKGVTILTRNVPVCTDLISLGDGTVVRKDVFFSGYRAYDGWIESGPVTLGAGVTIGEQSVVDIHVSMGDGAQLGHASSLHPGQTVPAGQAWHGTPAQPTDTDFRTVGPGARGTPRRALYGSWQLVGVLLLYLPLTVAGLSIVVSAVPQLNAVATIGVAAFGSPTFYLEALIASLIAFFGGLLIGLLAIRTVPRLLNLMLEPGRTYPLYGFHYSVQRVITRMTNIRFFTTLFGDSSAIVHYLRSLGYDLCRVEQTGSNFGSLVKHDIPYLTQVGSGTMIADGLSVINTEYSATSFRVSRTTIGPRNFLGNNIVYPPRGRTGDNCLLATKAMVPVDGPVREGVGLLGSPSFEIPRTVMRDRQFDDLATGDELRRRLAAKNKHNALTASLFLLVRWVHFFGLSVITMAAVDLYPTVGAGVFALAGLLTLAFTVCYFALVERIVTAIHPLKPLYCSIYDLSFWRHERYWKLSSHRFEQILNGTPFKTMVWRLLGVRIGGRVFDDGCALPERTLVTIGHGSTLNAATVIQCHSQEDGAFKSDRITLGANVTVGVGALVHYGTTVGDNAELTADAFLMKGEEVPPREQWGGNPSRDTGVVSARRSDRQLTDGGSGAGESVRVPSPGMR
ncbi:Pls/PosA family non-ribosomal peptide synthetase [Streptomyces sp. NPDC051738]|uniref:Pls/PosA family non-ribosomal peptide synthetase n=1 Tax=Streptomyces sp. NPDC051738 TaxID=3365672 RepID=UPI0037D5FB63